MGIALRLLLGMLLRLLLEHIRIGVGLHPGIVVETIGHIQENENLGKAWGRLVVKYVSAEGHG
jgi:hypothetical protein